MTYKEKYEAVKAELERRMYDDYNDGEDEEDAVAQGVCASMIMFMDSLPNESTSEELKTEIDNIWKPRFNLGWDEKSLLSMNHEGFTTIAKHFFELGLKAQKGE